MFRELAALLKRYFISSSRFKKRVINDLIMALVIGASVAISHIGIFGALAVLLYLITLPFTFLVSVRTAIGELVSEKSSGIKEYLKLNGLSNLTYRTYCFSVATFRCAFFTLFIVLGLAIGTFLGNFNEEESVFKLNIDLGQTILAYVTCALATVSFILFMTTLFSDPKVASNLGGIAYIGISLMSLLVLASKEAEYYYLVCLFPQSALSLTLFMNPKKAPAGVTRERIIYFMIGDFILYLFLYVLIDHIVKDDNGETRISFSIRNLCKKRKKNMPRKKKTQEKQNELSAELLDQPNEESEQSNNADESSAVYHEAIVGTELLDKAVQICNLSKRFKKFKAVDDISFSIFKGQIFCLLGHNGAGKTTSIKMLTGILEMDEGDIYYDGLHFMENFKEIRTKIGICAQRDILFEKYKVHEHLELIAKLRKLPSKDIPNAVEEALQRVNLINERDRYAEDLSGGNKRKLCLAMAILGNTKVVFLDEPTSGMDPQNRRVMWHHLKQLREQGMTILLTTHHLDEADELADRIAIMSKGKLLALGTSEFFKKNFGVGYHLNIMPISDKLSVDEFVKLKPSFQETIKSVISAAKFDDQTAIDVLKCALPFSSQQDFPRLFEVLESNEAIRLTVEMNTLEDVFVNIGLSEDLLLKGENPHTQVNINVEPPECLKEKPVYSFLPQTFALIKRRMYLLTRSKKNLFLLTLPIFMTAFGILGARGFDNKYAKFGFFQVIILIAFALTTATYCSLPVFEREEKLKYLMDVMGLRKGPYWISNIVVDFIAVSIVSSLIYCLYLWFYNDLEFHSGKHVIFADPETFLAMAIPHGFALVTLGYAYNFMFDKSLNAVKYFPLMYFFILFSLGGFFVYKLHGEETISAHPYLEGIVGLLCPSTMLLQYMVNSGGGLKVFECVLFETAYGVFYFVLTLIIDSLTFKFSEKQAKKGWTAPEPHQIPIEKEDIETEKQRFDDPANQDPIKVKDLVKLYDNGYTAVQGVTFGVAPGQIFGLLGPNGAGKSTTFNILTAAIPKSEGSVKLLNQEINRNMPKVFEHVGICPQFNGLWDFLTVKEHLTLFGNLKGLRGAKLDQIIEYYLNVLQLKAHAHKKAEELSGGNQRKLCVANAFIGSANLIFLDEPSTGVDPLARRFLWNSIQQVLAMRQASVVLTTHSMYEAESLSHKIGILINGRFVCIGPTQYLKEKHSQGYKITISLMSTNSDPQAQILEIFPQAVRLKEVSYVQQTYHLPFQGFTFSEAFKKLEILKGEGVIKDFSIYNTTLEQIFIYFSKFQINVGNENLEIEEEEQHEDAKNDVTTESRENMIQLD